MAEETNPLLVAYDKAIHDVTVKHREQNQAFWFAYDKAHMKGRSEGQQPAMSGSTAPVHPVLAAYRADLDAVTKQFNEQNKGYLFWYSGSKIKPLSKVVKPEAIQHKTEIIKPTASQAE